MGKSILQRIRDLIGAPSVSRINAFPPLNNMPTLDARKTDYAFWDKARRGAARGLEVSGLFIKPLASKIASWVAVPSPTWKTQNESTQDELNKWWSNNHSSMLSAYEESLNLGDSYLIVNPDLTCTVVPPDVVNPIFDAQDPALVVGWEIREVYPIWGSFRNALITDRYTMNGRERKIVVDGRTIFREAYPNLIGRLPIVHIANKFGTNELFGRPEAEGLLNALHRYGDVMDAAVRGNTRQGRPTPVIENMGSPEALAKFWEQYGQTETRTLPDGTTESVTVIRFDPDQLLTLSGTSTFKYAQPGSFAADTEILLGLFFYLVLQHTEIPEFAWGNAIGSSKASAESQLEPFIKWLGKKRAMSAGWMTEISRIVLAYMSIIRPDLPTETETPIIQWSSITSQDARITLNAVNMAYKNGWVDDVDGLRLLPLTVNDAKDMVERGKKAQEERIEAQFNRQIDQQKALDNQEPRDATQSRGDGRGETDQSQPED